MSQDNYLYRKLTQDNFVTEKIDVIHNNLLGSYNDDDKYIIAPIIVEELIKLPKTKKTAFGNSIFCVGQLLGYRELVFELMFNEKIQDNNAYAVLYVLEEVDKINGYLQNTLKTKLGVFGSNVDNFIEATYEYFNISTSEDDDEEDGMDKKLIDDLNNEDSFIIAKKQFSLLLEKLLTEKYLDAYGKYFTFRMSTLTKNDNEFSKNVLESFNKQYKIIENVFLHEKNYKMLNELLDKCIEEVSGINELMIEYEKGYLQQVAPALESFTESIKKLNEKYELKALNMLDKEDRKKVEEVLGEIKDYKALENENEIVGKPSIEQIVNDVKNGNTTQTEEKAVNSEVSKEEKGEIVKEKEEEKSKEELPQNASYIKDMLDNKRQDKENFIANIHSQEQSKSSFYDSFVGGHSSPDSISEEKVTNPDISKDKEEFSKNTSTVASLKDRISRLQKFKNDSGLTNEVSMESNIESSLEEVNSSENMQDQKELDNQLEQERINKYLKEKQENYIDNSFDM